MPDVFGRGGVDSVLGDVGGVIADAFETARNKNQIEITAQLIRIMRHAFDQFATGLTIQFIQFVIAWHDGTRQLHIFPNIGIHTVFEHRHGVLVHRGD